MISVETKYQNNIRSTVGRDFTYRFSIEDFRDALIKALLKQINDIQILLQEYNSELRALRDEVKGLRNDRRKDFEELKKSIIKFLDKIPGMKNKKQVADQMANNLITKLKPEIEIGDLATYSDGTIRFKGSVIPMRDQLNDLCRMFMSRPNQLVL